MKTHKLKFIIFTIGIFSLSSCTNLLFTSLDVLRPAKVNFAPKATDLLIINNTVNQPASMGHKTQLLNQNVKGVMLNTDSMSLFCLEALTEELDSKSFFTNVKLNSNSINKSKDFSKTDLLSHETVVNLCKSYNANAVLSLDKIKVNDEILETYYSETSTFLASLEFRFQTYWSIHYPNNVEVTRMQYSDTVFWESESYSRSKSMNDLPDRHNALIDGALYVGKNCVNRLVPYWDKIDRYFFNPRNKLMRQGMDSLYVKNWNSAIGLWKKALEKTNRESIKAQAANNIAIAYEILGDIDKAIEYANESLYSFGSNYYIDFESFTRLSNYIDELQKRKEEIVQLKKQLGE